MDVNIKDVVVILALEVHFSASTRSFGEISNFDPLSLEGVPLDREYMVKHSDPTAYMHLTE